MYTSMEKYIIHGQLLTMPTGSLIQIKTYGQYIIV